MYLTPSSFSLSVVSYSRIDLSWLDPDQDTPLPSIVQIQRKALGGVYSDLDTLPFGTVSYSDDSCSQSIKYYYRIRYYLDSSHYSAWTAELNAWTPPQPVSGLTVSFDGVSTTLSWTNNGDYTYVYYAGTPGIAEQHIDGYLTSITFNSDPELTSYTYYVQSYYSLSTKRSTVVSVSGTSGVSKPTNLTATCPTTTSCNLAWEDNSSIEDGYEIYRDSDLIHTTAAGATSYSDSPLSESTLYNYSVRAKSGSNYSNYAIVSVTTGAMPNADPVIGTATATGQTTITLTWVDTCTNAVAFYIYQSADDITYEEVGYVVPSVQVCYVTGLTSNVEYFFKVRAKNDSGWSNYSSTVHATTEADLDPPSSISATVYSSTQIDLAWTNNSLDADYLYVEMRPESGTYDPGSAISISGDAVGYRYGALTEGTTYYFRVRPYNSTLLEYGNYSVPVSKKLTYTSVLSIQINETYVGFGNLLQVTTDVPTNYMETYWTSKPLDFADQNPALENTWKTADRIHLDYIDMYAKMPLTVKVSADGGVTWHREIDRVIGVGDGTNKCDDFWFEPLTAQYFVVQLRCDDNTTGATWTGFDMYYILRSGVFEVIPQGQAEVGQEAIDGGEFGEPITNYIDGGEWD